jgi:hypothetical protein
LSARFANALKENEAYIAEKNNELVSLLYKNIGNSYNASAPYPSNPLPASSGGPVGVPPTLDGEFVLTSSAISMMPSATVLPSLVTMKGNDSLKDGIISRTVKKIKKLFGFGGDIDPKLRGLESEKRVLKELGLAKNTTKVSSEEGSSIPDALDENNSVEIKDSKYVSLTRQLRIQTKSAKLNNRQSILITGEKTNLSSNTQRAFNKIIRRSDLGGF